MRLRNVEQVRSSVPTYATLGELGFTPDDLAEIPALKDAKAVVSPWLWIFSVVGFAATMLNTSRINAMWQRHGGTKYKGLKKPRG